MTTAATSRLTTAGGAAAAAAAQGANAGAALSGPPSITVHLTKFGGSAAENPEIFLRTISNTRELYSWSDAQTIAFASLHLKGKAVEWFDSQELPTWADFKKALLSRFWMDPSRMLPALTKRVQGEKESVRDYADALCALVKHSRDPHLKTTLQHFFISGLREDLQSFVKTRRPETFEATVAEGEYYEAVFSGTAKSVQPSLSGEAARGKEAPTMLNPFKSTKAEALRDSTNDPIEAITRKLEKLRLQLYDLERSLGTPKPGPADASALKRMGMELYGLGHSLQRTE